MTSQVLVTGITGFVGSALAARLLALGHEVRGTLRDRRREPAIRAALAPFGGATGQLQLVTLDLERDAGWPEAMAGIRYLLHAASPLPLAEPRDRAEIVRPAVQGTQRALSAALAAGVERIVVTSSVAAIAYGHPPCRTTPFGPADWTDLAGRRINAYTEAKTRAEALAWQLLHRAGRGRDLVAINPGVILGPLLHADTAASVAMLVRLLRGEVPLLARLPLLVADLRDVVDLHVAAMLQPAAGGQRFPIATGNYTLPQLVGELRDVLGPIPHRLPRLVVPDRLALWLSYLHPQLRGRLNEVGLTRQLDSSAAIALLGRPLHPIRATLANTAHSIVRHGLLERKKRD